jgi:hypothetical protein
MKNLFDFHPENLAFQSLNKTTYSFNRISDTSARHVDVNTKAILDLLLYIEVLNLY